MSPREQSLRLQDIADAVASIRLAAGTLEPELWADVQFAAIQYHLGVVGEAARHLPLSVRRTALWRPYVELRNHMAHEYFRLERGRIIVLAGEGLTKLDSECARLLDDL